MCRNFEELRECRREAEKQKGQIKELEDTIKQLLAEGEQPPKPSIKLLSMSAPAVLGEMQRLGLHLMYPTLMDFSGPYYYTDDEGWAEIVNYIYGVFNMPSYIAFRMDCEDFGILLKGLVSALFGLNYFAFTVGQIPQGCHGFNFLRSEDRHVVLEPQLARFQEWGEFGYLPRYALL